MIEGRIRAICVAVAVFFSASAFSQSFAPGNIVVTVEGCGVYGGTCTNVPNGTGTGSGNSSNGGYGDNQAAPLTLFQYTPNSTSSATFINSLVLPQNASGANVALSGEYGSSSEGTLNLSGAGQYLTLLGYGVNDAAFNANPVTYGSAGSLAQSGSLTGQSYTAIPRVLILVDANGNVNSATAVYNVFNTNNPRSAFTLTGATGYISGQGTGSDATGGVFYLPVLGVPNNSPTAITGLDATSKTIAQDTRDVRIINNTLYVSVDSKEGSGNNRSFIGTLGTPPATSLYNSGGGPSMLSGYGNTGGTGKVTISTGANSNGNNLNAGLPINLSAVNYYLASPSVLYVSDSGDPKNDSNGDNNSNGSANIGDGGLQKWINSKSDGSGTWSLAYTLYQGLNLVNNGGSTGTSGLYGLAGTVSGNNVQLYATNYTLNDLDFTYLYGITDNITYTTAPQASGESFTVLDTAPADSNFKGVSFAPTIPNGDVEITSVISGLTVTTSGSGCVPSTFTTPVTLTWTPGSTCTLSVTTPQSGGTGVQYAFAQWQDGTTGTSDVVTAPATTATYTATFTTQYQLTTAAGSGGTVSPGGYFAAGSDATVTATPNVGYYFVNFTGTTNSTDNPLTLVMNSPQSETANFAPVQSQTITCTSPPPSSAAYGTSFTLACSASSGLAVVYTSSGSCSNVGATYTMTSGTGACGVYVNQPGNSQYSAAPQVSYSVSATPGSTSINVTSVSPASEDYALDAPVTITAVLSWTGTGSTPIAANVSIGGNGNGTYGATSCGSPSGNTITCMATYTPTTADGVDSYNETAAFSGDANYTNSSSPQTNNFAIASASSTTAVSTSGTPSLYGQSVTFTATINGENNNARRNKRVKHLTVTGTVTWSDNTNCGTTPVTPGSSGTATCTTSALAVGDDPITATYSGDSNHGGSSGTLSGGQQVNQASTSLNVTSVIPSSEDYGQDAPATITAVLSWTGSGTPPAANAVTIGGNGPSGYSTTRCGSPSGNTITCTATYTPTASDAPGSYSETAAFAGDSNYGGSGSSQTNNFVINNASSTVAVSSSQNPSTYGESVTFTATITGEYNLARRRNSKPPQPTGTVTWSDNTGCATVPVTTQGTEGVATCSTSSLSGGNNPISATYSGDSEHNGSSGSLNGGQTVNPASQTITFTMNAPASAVYNSNFTVAATASSGLPVTLTSAGSCTNVGATYTMTSGTGTCSVIANQSGNSNYSAAPPVTQTTTATKASQTITFTTPPPASAGYDSSFTVAAAATSGLSVTYANLGVCTNSGATYTMTAGSGQCEVVVNQSGDTDYSAAPQLDALVNAKKGTPTATFTGAPATAPYQSTFTVMATINDEVTPTITATGACSISGTMVTMTTGMGMCTTTAKWAATTDWNAVTLTQHTTAQKLTPVITWPTPDPVTYGTPLSATQLNATASYNNSPVSGTFTYTPPSGRVLAAGNQTLKATFKPSMTTDFATATDSVTLVVNPQSTTTTITKTVPASPTTNEAVKVYVNVAAAYKRPTGTVTVNSDNGGPSCTVNLISGGGNCSMTFTSAGSYNLTGTYNGDNNNQTSTSAGFQLTVH